MSEIYVKVTHNGPYLVYGTPEFSENIIVTDNQEVCIEYSQGEVFEIKSNPVALCRCGNSKNAPFCDNSHLHSDFDGEEKADFSPVLDSAEKYDGPAFTLYDKENLCALARFCDANGTVWNLIMNDDDFRCSELKREVSLCPSGRLILFDKEGNMIEEELPQSIAAIEDSGLKISGPLWLKGKIRVESEDGRSYEVRNRQTLCRCGKSKNKPFCDSSHWHVKFKAMKSKE